MILDFFDIPQAAHDHRMDEGTPRGALAQANDGLITRNAADFHTLFPMLNIVVP